jgi:23S rRNA (uridine2552-2'-O)-methyltransferase
MPRSKSSQKWLKEHFNDFYVKKAQAEGYRSRAIYKLKEINEKEQLFKPGMVVVDLGAAPGGWTQYVSEQIEGRGKIIALDRIPMDNLIGVDFILGDFQDDAVLQQLTQLLPEGGVDVVLSDMAPNMSGSMVVDIPRAMYLVELAFDFAQNQRKENGVLLMKLFHGEGFDDVVKLARQTFQRVTIRKPSASRSRSRETYLLAKGYHL